MTDEDQVELGRAARQMLDNKAYKWAWQEMERVLVDQLAVFEVEKDRAEYMRQLLASSRKHRQLLERAVRDGEFVAEHLRREQERKRFWQRKVA